MRDKNSQFSILNSQLKKGFTLIELLVTISISLILLSQGLVRYNDFKRKQEVKQNALSFVSVLRQAQSDAITGEKGICAGTVLGYRVAPVVGSNTEYTVSIDCDGSFVDSRSYTLGPRTEFAASFPEFRFNSLYGSVYRYDGTQDDIFVTLSHATDTGVEWQQIVISLGGDISYEQVSAGTYPPTPVPPTATPVPPTATPIPTATPVPPTATPIPTATPVPPTSTPTPVPPTPTPSLPSSCYTINSSFEDGAFGSIPTGWSNNSSGASNDNKKVGTTNGIVPRSGSSMLKVSLGSNYGGHGSEVVQTWRQDFRKKRLKISGWVYTKDSIGNGSWTDHAGIWFAYWRPGYFQRFGYKKITQRNQWQYLEFTTKIPNFSQYNSSGVFYVLAMNKRRNTAVYFDHIVVQDSRMRPEQCTRSTLTSPAYCTYSNISYKRTINRGYGTSFSVTDIGGGKLRLSLGYQRNCTVYSSTVGSRKITLGDPGDQCWSSFPLCNSSGCTWIFPDDYSISARTGSYSGNAHWKWSSYEQKWNFSFNASCP